MRDLSIKFQYDTLYENLPEFKETGWTIEDFGWAILMRASRLFECTYEGGKVEAWNPLSDMFNHNHVPNAHYYFNDETQMNITWVKKENKQINRGEEILISYGVKGNGHFFNAYGFFL